MTNVLALMFARHWLTSRPAIAVNAALSSLRLIIAADVRSMTWLPPIDLYQQVGHLVCSPTTQAYRPKPKEGRCDGRRFEIDTLHAGSVSRGASHGAC